MLYEVLTVLLIICFVVGVVVGVYLLVEYIRYDYNKCAGEDLWEKENS